MKGSFKLIPPVASRLVTDRERRSRRGRRPVQVSVPMIHEKDVPLYRHLLRRDHARSRHRLGQSRHLPRGGARSQHSGVWISPASTAASFREKYSRRTSVPGGGVAGSSGCCFSPAATRSSTASPKCLCGRSSRQALRDDRQRAAWPADAGGAPRLRSRRVPCRTRRGPRGRWRVHRYYASHVRDEPIVRVRRVYHRQRSDPHHGVADAAADRRFVRQVIVESGMIWDEIESAGLNGSRACGAMKQAAIACYRGCDRAAAPATPSKPACWSRGCHSVITRGAHVVVDSSIGSGQSSTM